jgi:hypothetical protein
MTCFLSEMTFLRQSLTFFEITSEREFEHP